MSASSAARTTDLSEIHDELRAVARDLLGAAPPDEPVDWSLLAAAGWLGLEVPEALDGAGASFAEVAVVLGEMGRAATSSAYLGAAVLGIGALTLTEPSPERDDLLRSATAGRTTAVLALAGDDERAEATLPFRVARSAGQLRVTGTAAFVPDAAGADRLLLPALDGDGAAVLAAVDPADVEVVAQPVLDATRRLATVTAAGVAVDPAAVWAGVADAAAVATRLRDRAAVAVACDGLGVAEAMLDATVAYAKVREQFGRPIGSFQAVKHACADMAVRVAVARELVAAAVEGIAAGGDGASVAASMAASYTGAAAVEVVGSAMQLHGGIGYTWESGVHTYLKRAALDRSLFGSPAAHRRRLARRYTT